MKKVFAGLFIMMMGLFFVACSGGGDIKGVIEKAKAEGANWTEAQWKDAYKEVMTACKPMLKEMEELQKKAQAPGVSEEDQMKLFGDLASLMDKNKDLMSQMQEFEKICKENPTAKKVSEDEAFMKQLQEELGVNFDGI